jgi:hypothetical protein
MKYFAGSLLVITVGLLLVIPNAYAFDSQLQELQATQKQIRGHAEEYLKNNGGGQGLTVFKHQLRDWIESKLAALDEKGDEKALQNKINDLIKDAGLIFPGETSDNFIGHLDYITLKREGDLITLVTGVGIVCTYDESAYAYEWKDKKWNRIWMSEQTHYEKGKYFPRHISSIQILHPYDYDLNKYVDWRIILSLGYERWCYSNWHNIYWQLCRVDSSGMKPLLDQAQYAFQPYLLTGAFIRGYEHGEPGEVLIEFKKQSIDDGVHNRQAVYHYKVDRDSVHRIDPIALSPRDFVDEWIKTPWKQIVAWSSSDTLRKQHNVFEGVTGGFLGEFSPTMHCKTPDLWQVTLNTFDEKKINDKGSPIYFLVRWQPPYRFTMMNIRANPWPLCSQKDEPADEWRTLFPTEME